MRCITTHSRCRRGRTGDTQLTAALTPYVSAEVGRERSEDKRLEKSETDPACSVYGLPAVRYFAGSCGMEESHDAIDCELANLQPCMSQVECR